MATRGRLCGLWRHIVYPYSGRTHHEIGGRIVFQTNTHGGHRNAFGSDKQNQPHTLTQQKLFIFFCVTFLGRFCFATRISQSLLATLCLFPFAK